MNQKARIIEISFHEHKKMTITEVLQFVQKKQQENPDREYFMDGDTYAIVSQERD